MQSQGLRLTELFYLHHHKSTAPRFQVASQVSHQQNREIVSGLSGFRLGILIDNVLGLGFCIDYLLHQLENGDQTNVGVSLVPTDSMSWHNPTQSYQIEFRDRNNHGNINCYSSFFSSSSVHKPYTPCSLEYKYKDIKFWRCSKIKLCALWNSYSLLISPAHKGNISFLYELIDCSKLCIIV